MSLRHTGSLFSLWICGLLVSLAGAEDWPQWMGPERDGTYRESGVVTSIGESGLPIKWRAKVEGGYSGPAVAGNRVYLTDYRVVSGTPVSDPMARPELDGFERILCLDATTGDKIWQHEYRRTYSISYPAGPRATPTVDNGQVFSLGAEGDLIALDGETGEVLWQINLPDTYGSDTPVWGFSAHPLVTGNQVITMVGGEGTAVVAFDRNTGKEIWRSLTSSDAGYCPPSLIEQGGVTQLIVWHPQGLAGLNPETGKPYWEVEHAPDYGMSVSMPQLENNLLFVTGIQKKSLVLALGEDKPTAEIKWTATPKNSMSSGIMTPLVHDGVVYGADRTLGALVAAKLSDGERLWTSWLPISPDLERRVAHGTVVITRHQPSGKYYLFGESGYFSIAEMNAEGYQQIGEMKVVEPTQDAFGRKVIWSHPAYANQTGYFRNDKELVAVDLRGK